MRGAALVCLLLLVAVPVEAATFRARLIRASHNQQATDPRLEDIQPKLQKVFGYERYHQLGQRQTVLTEGRSQRMDLGEGFVLFVRERGVKDGEHLVDLEWYSGKAAISQQSLKLRPNQYLFIKGPEVGKDWIILSVSVIE